MGIGSTHRIAGRRARPATPAVALTVAAACTSRPPADSPATVPPHRPSSVDERPFDDESSPPEPETTPPAGPAETWHTDEPVRERTRVACGAVDARDCRGEARGQLPLEPSVAFGSLRDLAAEQKIREALDYWETSDETRLALLLGTSTACEQTCSRRVQARLWMYVGIVRGVGQQDRVGAACAFRTALAWDRGVELDRDIATDGVKAAFESERCAASPSWTSAAPP